MEYKGKVLQFGKYTRVQLERMKQDLKLEMSLQMLSFCAAYYRGEEKRDPLIAELLFLDRFAAARPITAADTAPTQLLTNDAFVAETYADLMRKRHEIYPTRKTPCTLSEALELATVYIQCAGKSPTFSDVTVLTEDASLSPSAFSRGNYVTAQNADFGFRALGGNRPTPKADDRLVLLVPAPNCDIRQYREQVEALLNHDTLSAEAVDICSVGESGLLREILRMTDGAYLELARLSRTGDPIGLSMLSNAYAGNYLLRLPADRCDDFVKAVTCFGLRALAFGYLQKNARITVVTQQIGAFSLASDFLRILLPLSATTAALTDEKHGTPCTVSHIPLSRKHCAYLASNTPTPNQTASTNRHLCAVAASHPQGRFFLNAIETALVPILTLAAAGCDHTAQRLALGLRLPAQAKTPTEFGYAMSTVLGLYRIEAELGMPHASYQITNDANTAYPSLTVASIAKAEPCPTHFVKEGNHVFCIAPATNRNGLLDFAALRDLLECLARWHRDGILKSARVLCRESLPDVLADMRGSGIGCRMLGETLFLNEKMPVAIVLETTEPIQAQKVGVTFRCQEAPAPAVQKQFAPKHCLIRTERPSVVICAAPHDVEARILWDELETRGAKVTFFKVDAHTDADAIARAVMSAQALIVCRGVRLPQDEGVRFAVDTLRRACGRVIYPGVKKLPENQSGIALENGFYEAMLTQICTFEK